MTTNPAEEEFESLAQKIVRWRTQPAQFVKEALNVKTMQPWQVAAMDALVYGDRVAVRSGHGVGKSAFLSWVLLWWHCTHKPAKTACTAPTGHQLDDILWSELGLWSRRLPAELQNEIAIKSGRLELVSDPNSSFAVARTARREQPEALQGFHSPNMLFVIDEASGVDDIVFQVGEGSMTTKGAKTIMTGNPTRTSGYFFDAFHRLRERWQCFKVSSEDSELVDQDFCKDIAIKYGKDSNVYRVRVQGEFPSSEDDVVIPLELCESAVGREVEPSGIVVWGIDVARFGDDRSTLCKRQGNTVLEPVQFWRQQDTMQLSGRIIAQYEKEMSLIKGNPPEKICVDVIGIGAGVVDRLKEVGLPVVGVNVSERPSVDEKYLRMRDELWFKLRDWLEGMDVCLPNDQDLIAELCSPKFEYTSNGRIKVEGKDEMKKRGVSSPDLAESLLMTMAVATRASDRPGSYLSGTRPTQTVANSEYDVFAW